MGDIALKRGDHERVLIVYTVYIKGGGGEEGRGYWQRILTVDVEGVRCGICRV